MSQLSGDFIVELAKACIVSKEILEVVKPHLKYSYLDSEAYKSIFKYIFDYHGAHDASPTVGLLSQNVKSRDALEIIAQIRDANVFDNKKEIVESFQEFVKRSRLHLLWLKVEDIHNGGNADEAIKVLAEESKEIHEFSLVTKLHSRIFADFDKRQMDRQQRDFTLTKIPTGIPQLDYHSRGGPDIGTGFLGIARTGVGKTTFLRSLGFHAAFRGYNVLHFASADSTKQEIEDGYDAAWTGVNIHEIKEGRLTGVDVKQIEKAKKAYLAQCGEIYIHAFEQFNAASILDCRNILMELLKTVNIKLVLFDYLEKFDPGDGKKYSTNQEGSTARKIAVAEKIVGIATEFKVLSATMTQANDIPKELWNDPAKVLTRSNIANAKATADPFAYVVTLNQTEDENDKNIMRIHDEKLRHYRIYSYSSTYKIVQNREVGRFIDVAQTNELFWDMENKKIRKGVL